VDLSPRLVELAGAQPSVSPQDYRVADLSEPFPDLGGRLDAVASFFALDDGEGPRGVARTRAQALKPGCRGVLGFNNPYDYVVRKGRGSTYFETGGAVPCGLASVGVPVSFYHHTLPDYLDAFLDAGLHLTRIVDVDAPSVAAMRARGEPLPP